MKLGPLLVFANDMVATCSATFQTRETGTPSGFAVLAGVFLLVIRRRR
jgi:MYXO-CTERM domain-containing protein